MKKIKQGGNFAALFLLHKQLPCEKTETILKDGAFFKYQQGDLFCDEAKQFFAFFQKAVFFFVPDFVL